VRPIENINNFDEELPEVFSDLPLEELEYLGEIYEDYYTEGHQKRELRIDWNPYEEFSAAFLDKHYELVLLNIFHHIMAFLLFPADCSCQERCLCHRWRQKTILSLNTARYNRLCRVHEDSNVLHAIKSLWRLPDEAAFRELYPTSYPLWAINNGLKNKEKNGDFKIISQLVDTFLRLGQTYKTCISTREASFSEAVDMLGDYPLTQRPLISKKWTIYVGKKPTEPFLIAINLFAILLLPLSFAKRRIQCGIAHGNVFIHLERRCKGSSTLPNGFGKICFCWKDVTSKVKFS
jgi:hypothetical protein